MKFYQDKKYSYELSMDPEGPYDLSTLQGAQNSEPSGPEPQKRRYKSRINMSETEKREIRRISNRLAATRARERREIMIRTLEQNVYILTGVYPNFKHMVSESGMFDGVKQEPKVDHKGCSESPDTSRDVKRQYLSNKHATVQILQEKHKKRRHQNNIAARHYRSKRTWYINHLQEIVQSATCQGQYSP